MTPVESPRPRFRVGVDIGGTFTDIVLLDADGRIHTKKVSSSVSDYAQAIVEGLAELFGETGLDGGVVDEVIHGTTVASNAILELRGARTGLITTRGCSGRPRTAARAVAAAWNASVTTVTAGRPAFSISTPSWRPNVTHDPQSATPCTAASLPSSSRESVSGGVGTLALALR